MREILHNSLWKPPSLCVLSVSWVQYKRTPPEGTLTACSMPSTSSADTRSGPWTWATKKVLMWCDGGCVSLLFWLDFTQPPLLRLTLHCGVYVSDRMHPGLGGVRGQPSLCAGAGNLLWLLHGEDCSAASTSRQARHSGIQPPLRCHRSPGHLLGGSGRKGKKWDMHVRTETGTKPSFVSEWAEVVTAFRSFGEGGHGECLERGDVKDDWLKFYYFNYYKS